MYQHDTTFGRAWREDVLWVLGFLFSYFLFSAIVSFVFWRDQSVPLLCGMGMTFIILLGGELIKRRLN